jgi:SRSO17 transposase
MPPHLAWRKVTPHDFRDSRGLPNLPRLTSADQRRDRRREADTGQHRDAGPEAIVKDNHNHKYSYFEAANFEAAKSRRRPFGKERANRPLGNEGREGLGNQRYLFYLN